MSEGRKHWFVVPTCALLAVVVVLALAVAPAIARRSARVATAEGVPPNPSAGYWVEGAMPAADANAATGEGCVPYSSDRQDVHVCSPDAARDWVPGPRPYYDPAICTAALEWFNAARTSGVDATDHPDPRFPMAAAAQGESDINPDSCLVVQAEGTPAQQAQPWEVVFQSQKDPAKNVSFTFDPREDTNG